MYYDGVRIIPSIFSLDDKPAVRLLGNDSLMMPMSLSLKKSTEEGSTEPSRENLLYI